jgi:hypothetical protein
VIEGSHELVHFHVLVRHLVHFRVSKRAAGAWAAHIRISLPEPAPRVGDEKISSVISDQ